VKTKFVRYSCLGELRTILRDNTAPMYTNSGVVLYMC